MMHNHILIPLDGSEPAEQAIPHAMNIAADDTQITLVYVVSLPNLPFFIISPSPPAVPQETESHEHYVEKANTYLKGVRSQLTAQHDAIQIQVLVGNDAADKIIDFSDTHDIDVIVMATRGHSGIKRWVMGSVTHKVLQAATCPVFVIPA